MMYLREGGLTMRFGNKIVVSRIYPEIHAIGEPINFYSFIDLNKYLNRSPGYANKLMRKSRPIITTASADSKKYFIIERVDKQLTEILVKHLQLFSAKRSATLARLKL